MMFFIHPKVRAFLIRHGEVYTLRVSKRKREGADCLAASRRPFRKIGKGLVSYVKVIKNISPSRISKYVRKSGLPNAAKWIEALASFNKGIVPKVVHLYHVRMIKK